MTETGRKLWWALTLIPVLLLTVLIVLPAILIQAVLAKFDYWPLLPFLERVIPI